MGGLRGNRTAGQRNLKKIEKTLSRNICAAIICTFVLGLSISTNVAADEASNLGGTDQAALFEKYFKAAFGPNVQLRKPDSVPNIEYFCNKEFCENLIVELKSDFPIQIQQSEVSDFSKKSDASIIIRLFENKEDATKAAASLHPIGDEQAGSINFPNCTLTRFRIGNRISRVIVDIGVEQKNRANLACALFEVARGTGLNISQTYQEYAAPIGALSDPDFHHFENGIHNLLDLHWSPRTRSGMSQEEVNAALQSFVVKKLN